MPLGKFLSSVSKQTRKEEDEKRALQFNFGGK